MNRGRPTREAQQREENEEVVRKLFDGDFVESTPAERIMATSLMLAAGIPQAEIARRLHCNYKTVVRYVAKIRSTP